MSEIDPVVRGYHRTTLQFVVQELDIAWRCALEFDSLVRVLSQGRGTVTRVSGYNGQEGAVVITKFIETTEDVVDGVRTVESTYTYRFTQVDEPNKRMSIYFEYSENGGVPIEQYQITISMTPSSIVPKLTVVKFEYMKDLFEDDLSAAKCLLGCMCCCLSPLFWPLARNFAESNASGNLVRLCNNLKIHFTTYKPPPWVPKPQLTQLQGQVPMPVATMVEPPEAVAVDYKYEFQR